MSFDIDWEGITSDDTITSWLTEFLNERLDLIELPGYLSNLKVETCSLGDKSPEIIIRDISEPFDDFYAEEDTDTSTLHSSSLYSESLNRTNSSLGTQGKYEKRNLDTNSKGLNDDDDIPAISGNTNLRRKERSPFISDKRTEVTTGNANSYLSGKFAAIDISRSPSPIPSVMPVGLYQQPFASPLHLKQRSNTQSSNGYFPNVTGVGIVGLGGSYRSSLSSNGENGFESGGDTGSNLSSYTMLPANISIDGTNDNSSYGARKRLMEEEEKLKRLQKEARDRLERQRAYTELMHQKEKEKELKMKKRSNDVQLSVEVKFDGNIHIEVTCNLLLNYPSPDFIKLPIRLKITDLLIHSLGIITYIDQKVFLSFLCDINDTENSSDMGRDDGRQLSTAGINSSEAPASSKERIDIIKKLRIQGELGSGVGEASHDTSSEAPVTSSPLNPSSIYSSHSNFMDSYDEYSNTGNSTHSSSGSVLRNISKIEKFLLARLREMLVSEMAWPSWIELNFKDEDEEDEEEKEEEDDNDEEEDRNHCDESVDNANESWKEDRDEPSSTPMPTKRNNGLGIMHKFDI